MDGQAGRTRNAAIGPRDRAKQADERDNYKTLTVRHRDVDPALAEPLRVRNAQRASKVGPKVDNGPLHVLPRLPDQLMAAARHCPIYPAHDNCWSV
jgi:hypothetical protein